MLQEPPVMAASQSLANTAHATPCSVRASHPCLAVGGKRGGLLTRTGGQKSSRAATAGIRPARAHPPSSGTTARLGGPTGAFWVGRPASRFGR